MPRSKGVVESSMPLWAARCENEFNRRLTHPCICEREVKFRVDPPLAVEPVGGYRAQDLEGDWSLAVACRPVPHGVAVDRRSQRDPSPVRRRSSAEGLEHRRLLVASVVKFR